MTSGGNEERVAAEIYMMLSRTALSCMCCNTIDSIQTIRYECVLIILYLILICIQILAKNNKMTYTCFLWARRESGRERFHERKTVKSFS